MIVPFFSVGSGLQQQTRYHLIKGILLFIKFYFKFKKSHLYENRQKKEHLGAISTNTNRKKRLINFEQINSFGFDTIRIGEYSNRVNFSDYRGTV